MSKKGSGRAKRLSGEVERNQFINEVLINPIRPYDSVSYPGDDHCTSGTPYPGQAQLEPYDPKTGKLTASARHAANMGFAVWLPPGSPFTEAGAYQQLYNTEGKPDDNPGKADDAGRKTVSWPYKAGALDTLFRTSNASQGELVVMAIPCLAVNVPATTDTAQLVTYRVARSGSAAPDASAAIDPQLDKERLAQAACQAVI